MKAERVGKIRVLHVHTLPVVSGSGINTFLSMRGLPRERYDVELACAPGGRLLDVVRGAGMRVREVPHFVQPVAPLRDLRALYEVYRILRAGDYHVVHTHNSKAGFIGRLAAHLARVPVIVHTVHGFAFHDREPAWRRWLFRLLERRAARWCHEMIFISRPLEAWARREGVLRPGASHHIIYSGIELERFRPVSPRRKRRLRRECGVPPDALVVGMISKLWPGKGHEVLLEAFAALRTRLPGARLLLVGEGETRERLEHLARVLGLRHCVVFAGFMQDVRAGIGACDVTVLPSFFEGMGRVLLESMAMGVPVVASDVGGIPDIVDHRVTGLLVPPADAGELARALHFVLRDGERRAVLGRAGRLSVQARHGADAMAQQIEQVYAQSLQRLNISPGAGR
ncbi:glycosyltransferase [Desulfobaculum senezii]